MTSTWTPLLETPTEGSVRRRLWTRRWAGTSDATRASFLAAAAAAAVAAVAVAA